MYTISLEENVAATKPNSPAKTKPSSKSKPRASRAKAQFKSPIKELVLKETSDIIASNVLHDDVSNNLTHNDTNISHEAPITIYSLRAFLHSISDEGENLSLPVLESLIKLKI